MTIRELKQLKTKKGRDEMALFMIEGEKLVQEIPHSFNVIKYVVSESFAAGHERDILIYSNRAKCDVVRDSAFDGLADTVTPQGLIAVCEKKVFGVGDVLAPRIDGLKHFIILCENLNDPGNIGALVRTAAAAGATGVILTTGSADIYNPKVLRAAAGAVLRLPFIVDITLEDAFEHIKSNLKLPIYVAHPRGEVMPYNLDLQNSFCLLVGNESHGVSEAAAAQADCLVTLPMANNTESLNASVAGSILMYEAVRQRTMV